MKHARSDYDRIQDPENLIPEDEPVFLIRGQDTNAPLILKIYAAIAGHNGADRDLTFLVYEHSLKMERWQQEHGKKIPDLPSK